MLDGRLDRGDAAGVDGVGDLPVGPLGQTMVVAEVGQRDVDGPGGDVQAGVRCSGRTGPHGAGPRESAILPLVLLRCHWNWGKLR